ncbi:MAG TPA: hypothetical protein VIY08_01980, partial [Candidatus Nitrosocosmicus sp.]
LLNALMTTFLVGKRTSSQIIGYGLLLYFLGLSFRNAAKALFFFTFSKDKSRIYLELLQKY